MNEDQERYAGSVGRPMPVRRRTGGLGWSLMFGLWAVVFLMVWNLVRSQQPSSLLDPTAEPHPVAPRGDLADHERATIKLFRNASPSVVYITGVEYRRSFFSLDVFEIPQGAGSGFIWDRDGHVVTNYHVIASANAVEVTLADHSTWPARLVGVERDKDVAVLKIEAPPSQLTPLPIGSSSDLQVGQTVLAIGNPFGFDQTLTTGVVSALGREIQALTGRPIRDVIQTDAAINPGNSGGPLLDSSGRLIGVNTQIASPSGASAGIGFAVPVGIVNRVVPQIIRYGRVIRPGLGIQPFPDSVARQLGVQGVLIAEVTDGNGADDVGLRGTVVTRSRLVRRLGDIIVAINDQPVTTVYDLLDRLEQYKVGDTVNVTFIRNEEEHEATVKLQSLN